MDGSSPVSFLGFVGGIGVGSYLSYRVLRTMTQNNVHIQARIFMSVALTYAVAVGAFLIRGLFADFSNEACTGFWGVQESCTEQSLFLTLVLGAFSLIFAPLVYLVWLGIWLVIDKNRKNKPVIKPKTTVRKS